MTRPNLIVVLTDDQGRWAMPHRMEELVMPNLEELLDDSLELDQFYCASPVCSPARASLLTGRMPSAHGVHDWIVGDDPRSSDARYLEGQPTTPQVLAEAGYQCAMSGKWHLGDSSEPEPGFEYWFAHRYGGGPYFNAPIWRDGLPATEERYFTHAVTESALDFISTRDRNRPFYLQVNYTAPHDPWTDGNHPVEYVNLYAVTDFPSVPRDERHPWTLARSDFDIAFANPEPYLAGYCASLTAVDEGLGQIRDLLEEQGIDDNTVVIYTSDNGFSCGHHGVWGKGNGTWPLNFWDNSVRVPFVAHVPGGSTGVSDTLVSAASLHPTLCELAGVEPPADDWAAAGSIAPLLRGEAFEAPDLVVVVSEYGGARMITDGRWKYVARFDGPAELYDLHADPAEANNLAETQPERANSMAASLQEWYRGRERGQYTGYQRAVRGYGQLQPVTAGVANVDSYVQGPTDGAGVEADPLPVRQTG
ncbi:MAG: sulfatase-like hydrolase/transferase, partial [Propionibacteriaceae bacterium]|nr:sulfatase-like hydrolase/transferase [Propionibacteriaceae bacterium]